MFRFLATLAVLVSVGQVHGAGVVINEFLEKNDNGITDEDFDYSDWIELYNPEAAAVDLAGWCLTDDNNMLDKWQFPSVVIESGGYLLVFASSKDRTNPLGELHTNFKLSSSGEYLALVEPDGMTIAYQHFPYPDQTGGVSYGLYPDGSTSQVYMSPSPEAPNVPEPSSLILLVAAALGLTAYVRQRKRRAA
ncbi:MAG: lamin tail domain-containing protein [Candidatus Nealsonbacteria bacterium]|nr:lamin tail domain-containing protein [Candidatus Nealsonbacteria bacterium]